jgi:hypothetical protein
MRVRQAHERIRFQNEVLTGLQRERRFTARAEELLVQCELELTVSLQQLAEAHRDLHMLSDALGWRESD